MIFKKIELINMKKFLEILILGLFLVTPSQADDISDFQIEGMSIGDSLLDYFSEKEIKKRKSTDYKSKKFSRVSFNISRFENFEALQFHFKTKDKKYIIHQISGGIFYPNDIKNCFKKKKEITEEVSKLFDKAKKWDLNNSKHQADETGESISHATYFDFKSGDSAKVQCMNWSERLTSEKDWIDHLKLSIATAEIVDWYINEAHK